MFRRAGSFVCLMMLISCATASHAQQRRGRQYNYRGQQQWRNYRDWQRPRRWTQPQVPQQNQLQHEIQPQQTTPIHPVTDADRHPEQAAAKEVIERAPTRPNDSLNDPEFVGRFQIRGFVADLQQIIQNQFQSIDAACRVPGIDRRELGLWIEGMGHEPKDIERINRAIDNASLDEIDRLGRRFKLSPEVMKSLLIDAARFRLKQLVFNGGSVDDYYSIRFRFRNYVLEPSYLSETLSKRVNRSLQSMASAAEMLTALQRRETGNSQGPAVWPGDGKAEVLTLFSPQLMAGTVQLLTESYLVAGIGEDQRFAWIDRATPTSARQALYPQVSSQFVARDTELEADVVAENQIRIVNSTNTPLTYKFGDKEFVQAPNSSIRHNALYQRWDGTQFRVYGDIQYQLSTSKNPAKYRLYAGKSFIFHEELDIQFTSVREYKYRLTIDNSLNPVDFYCRINNGDQLVKAGESTSWEDLVPLHLEFDMDGGKTDRVLVQPGIGTLFKDGKSIINETEYVIASTLDGRWNLVHSTDRNQVELMKPPMVFIASNAEVDQHISLQLPSPEPERQSPSIPNNPNELPDLYLLSVGISVFRDENVNDLPFSDEDAISFAETWASQEGYRFRKVHAQVLLNETATKREIEKHLSWIENETTSKDIAILFFSSRGLRDSKNRYFLATHDMDCDQLKATCVSGSSINDSIHQLASSTSFVFFDTYHGKLNLNGVKRGNLPDHIIRRGRRTVAFSTAQTTAEVPPGTGHSQFVQALLDVTSDRRLSDKNEDHLLELSELNRALEERFRVLTGGKQATAMSKDADVPDDFVVYRFLD